MIYKWNSDITYNNKTHKVERNYEIVDMHNNQVAIAWAQDLHDKNNINLFDGRLIYNNHQYKIPLDACYNKNFRLVNENDEVVLFFNIRTEYYTLKRKKLFSKGVVEKQKHMSYEELVLGNRIFRMYNIHMGKDKDSFVLYEGDEVVAEILLKDRISNFGRFSDIYCKEDSIIKLVTFLYAYFLHTFACWKCDCMVNTDDDAMGTMTTVKNTNEFTESKFSQEFIDNMIAESRGANI